MPGGRMMIDAREARKRAQDNLASWRADGEYRNPIREGELSEARQVPIGTPVRVMNPWKKNSREDFSWGIWEHARVAHKYPHIAVLDNGMSVDYAEIAMQMRERSGKQCM